MPVERQVGSSDTFLISHFTGVFTKTDFFRSSLDLPPVKMQKKGVTPAHTRELLWLVPNLQILEEWVLWFAINDHSCLHWCKSSL